MEIIVGKTAGFCNGVKRAVEGAKEERKKSKEKIFCLGEIVHNPQVIQQLEDLGVKCVETLEETEGTVLIRSHGIPKEIYEIANEMKIVIKDYTCPNVLRIHKIVEEYSQKEYFIFLLGTARHPENLGTLSYCNENSYIIEKIEDIPNALEAFNKTNQKKLLLIAQTTFSLKKFNQIRDILQDQMEKDVDFIVKNTICCATELRQKETEELSKKVDTMIVIGGKNSSNTRKIYEIAKRNCKKAFFIETVKELDTSEVEGSVGIMAGASTPKESINEVVELLQK